MNKIINCKINAKSYTLLVDYKTSLLELLRNQLNLKGVKQGCEVGECGACSVIINNKVINSCIYLAVWIDKKEVITIEGISDSNENLSDIQKNFISCGAIQCGFCTPGLILATTIFLKNNPNPTKDEVKRGLSGNLCRCTGYQKILEAVMKTASDRFKNI